MIDKDLDKLQIEIDELNRLIDQTAGADDLTLGDDLETKRNTRLGILLLKLQDGLLEQRHFNRLQKWLQADTSALGYYIDFMSLTAMLHLHYHPDTIEKALSAAAGKKTE